MMMMVMKLSLIHCLVATIVLDMSSKNDFLRLRLLSPTFKRLRLLSLTLSLFVRFPLGLCGPEASIPLPALLVMTQSNGVNQTRIRKGLGTFILMCGLCSTPNSAKPN